MNRGTLITVVVLGLTVIGITIALLIEANQGPSFRPADYDSLEECLANVPTEWAPGSMQRDGAIESCHYVHNER